MGSKLKSAVMSVLLGSSIAIGSTIGYLAHDQYSKLKKQEAKVQKLEIQRINEQARLENILDNQTKLEEELENNAKTLVQILGIDGLYDDNNVLVSDKTGLEKIQNAQARRF